MAIETNIPQLTLPDGLSLVNRNAWKCALEAANAGQLENPGLLQKKFTELEKTVGSDCAPRLLTLASDFIDQTSIKKG